VIAGTELAFGTAKRVHLADKSVVIATILTVQIAPGH